MKKDVDYFHVYCLVGPVLGSAALMRVVEGNDFPFPPLVFVNTLSPRGCLPCKDRLWLVKTTIDVENVGDRVSVCSSLRNEASGYL